MGLLEAMVITIATIFLTAMFILSRLFIPLLGFTRYRIPKKLPKEFENAIKRLERSSRNKEDYAKKSYNYLSKKFHGEPGRVWHDFNGLFIKDVNKLWKKEILHCHQLGYLYRISLVKSKFFSEDDIKVRHKSVFLNLHQYLKVNIGDLKEKWVKVDIWAKHVGYKFGKTLPMFFVPFKYWKKRKTSFFSFLSVISNIFKKIF